MKCQDKIHKEVFELLIMQNYRRAGNKPDRSCLNSYMTGSHITNSCGVYLSLSTIEIETQQKWRFIQVHATLTLTLIVMDCQCQTLLEATSS